VRACFGTNADTTLAFSVTVLAVAFFAQLASGRLSLCR